MLVFGMLAFTAGCDSDSGSDTPSDSDNFVGTWAVVGLSDASGDLSAGFAQGYNSVLITFGNDDSVSLAVDGVDPNPDQSYSGTASVNEATSSIVATLSVGGSPTPLSFGYDFTSDTSMTLTASSTTGLLLGVLFGTSYADPVVFTLAKI